MSKYQERPPASSFAAWSLIIGVDPLRLVSLMGHASKQMVYEMYWNYVEGFEGDTEEMLEYFGKDFGFLEKANPRFRLGTVPGTVF